MAKLNIVATFSIPCELAHELSDLLIKESIRKELLTQVVNQPDKFDVIEKDLMEIVSRINVIKNEITTKYVPDEYCDDKYSWTYAGWDITENNLQIYET